MLRFDFVGRWTWGEFYAAASKACAMRKGIAYPIHIIADFQHSAPPPTGAVLHVRRAVLLAPNNIGLIVVSGGSAFVNGLVSVLCMIPELQSQKFATTSTLDAARKLVTEERV